LALLFIGGISCRKEPAGKPADVDYYTCTMHPSVKKQNPTDKCPICSMDLEPVKKKGASSGHDHQSNDPAMQSAEEHSKMRPGKGEMKGMSGTETGKKEGEEKPTEFSIPVTRLQQIGVTYAPMEKRPFQHSIRAAGLVAY